MVAKAQGLTGPAAGVWAGGRQPLGRGGQAVGRLHPRALGPPLPASVNPVAAADDQRVAGTPVPP